jgi:hypothetical protein
MLYVIAGAGFGQDLGFDKPDEDYDKTKFAMSFTESMAIVSKYAPAHTPHPVNRLTERGVLVLGGGGGGGVLQVLAGVDRFPFGLQAALPEPAQDPAGLPRL